MIVAGTDQTEDISIHVPREGDDTGVPVAGAGGVNFNPRPP